MNLAGIAARVREAIVDGVEFDLNEKRSYEKDFEPTEMQHQLVVAMRAHGIDISAIRRLLKISKHNFTKYFNDDVQDAFDLLKAQMGATVVRLALAGNVTALKYWLITHGGPEWRMPKETDNDRLANDVSIEDRVHFYLPPNDRDKPEEEEPPTIEGEAA